jgi:hypothetical protein
MSGIPGPSWVERWLTAAAAVALLALGACAGARRDAADLLPPPQPEPAAEELEPPRLTRFGEGFVIAAFPLRNLTGAVLATRDLDRAVRLAFEVRGAPIYDDQLLGGFFRRHRVRWVGGISRPVSAALLDEASVRAALFTSLELVDDDEPPKVALTARLVQTGPEPRILWMDSVALTGDERPGALGLGEILDPYLLRAEAMSRLARVLADFLYPDDALFGPSKEKLERRFAPREAHLARWRSGGDGVGRVAVVPFLNESGRPFADEILALQIVRHLAGREGVEVVEPGVVREAMLAGRIIQEDGVSLPQLEELRVRVGADLVVTGSVQEYVELGGRGAVPRVSFSVRALYTGGREMVWSSHSSATGSDRVYWFSAGRIRNAHTLASRMSAAVVDALLAAERPSEPARRE